MSQYLSKTTTRTTPFSNDRDAIMQSHFPVTEPKKQMGQRIVNSFQQSISLTSKKITEKPCYTGQVGQY